MPTYDFKCRECGLVFEDVAPMSVSAVPCEWCMGESDKQFSPNRNIFIPAYFGLPAGWNNAGSSTGEPWSRSSSIHAPQRKSFTQEFDKAWREAGCP